jgi:hypothetical protein
MKKGQAQVFNNTRLHGASVAGKPSGFLILHSPHGTGSSSKILWMTVSFIFSFTRRLNVSARLAALKSA